MGKVKITMSLKIFEAALAYQKAVRLMQSPSRPWFQIRGIGVHWKMVAKMLATA